MSRLDSYIGRQVVIGMALVLLVLGGLDLLFSMIEELGRTNELYGGMDAIEYVLLTFPRHIYELLPMTALIGALLGLGMLAQGNELVVMQSSGVAVSRIVLSVMKPALVIMLLGLVLGEYVAPRLELRAEQHKSMAYGEEIGLSRFGHWTRDGDAFIHFNSIETEGVLLGVSLLIFDGRNWIERSVEAERAVFVAQDQGGAQPGAGQNGVVQRERLQPVAGDPDAAAVGTGGFWMLQNGREIIFAYEGDEQVSSEVRQFSAQNWDLDLTPDLLQVLILDSDKMAMTDLYRYARRFERQGQDAAPYFLAFWKKALRPLTTAILVLVAVSFIFGPLREATTGSRVFSGICFGLAFTIVERLIHNLSLVYQLSPLFGVVLPIVLIAGLGMLMFRRVG